jgi:hypothetical protein
MKSGNAATWTDTYTAKYIDAGRTSLGSWADFIKEFKASFEHSNSAANALAWLTTQRVIEKSPGKYSMSLAQYISQFQSNIATSKVTNESTLCYYFSSGIPPSLSGKIYLMEKVPTTITEWYSHTQRIDNQQRRAFLTSQQHKGHSFINPFTPTHSSSAKE